MSTEGTSTTELVHDEVKSSIELLDKILSEFDEFDSIDAQYVQQGIVEKDLSIDSTTSLTGHQSEDDGYMSMNGRKAKFVLNIKSVGETNNNKQNETTHVIDYFNSVKPLPPPPVEEAEKIIASLLPEISTNSVHKPDTNSEQKPLNFSKKNADKVEIHNELNQRSPVQTTATQTTLPKVYRSTGKKNPSSQYDKYPDQKGPIYGSLPFSSHNIHGILNSPTRMPPRTVPGTIEKHREVKRSVFSPNEPFKYKIDNENEFSDDSLNEKSLKEINKQRTNIAWEVPFNDSKKPLKKLSMKNEKLDKNSCDIEDIEIWIGNKLIKLKKDDIKNGFGETFVIRRRKRQDIKKNDDIVEKKCLSNSPKLANRSYDDFRSYISSLDNVQSLINDGVIDKDQQPQFNNNISQNYHNVLVNKTLSNSQQSMLKKTSASLPTLSSEDLTYCGKGFLATTKEEDEKNESINKPQQISSPLRRIEQNINVLLDRDNIDLKNLMNSKVQSANGNLVKELDTKLVLSPSKSTSNTNVQKSASQNDMEQYNPKKFFSKRSSSLQKCDNNKDMFSSHFVNNKNDDCFFSNGIYLRHDFPPLPPSPVEEDDEYSEVYLSNKKILKTKADTLPTDIGNNGIDYEKMPPLYYQLQKNNQKSNSLNTKLECANYFQSRRSHIQNLSNRSMSSDRYPYQNDSTYLNQNKIIMNQKRASQNSQAHSKSNSMQTSCSLPETPIFNRLAYCDIPRTPLKKSTADSSTSTLLGSMMPPRQSNTIATLSAVNNYGTGPLNYRRGNSITGLESAVFSGELLRITGGPGRGWYPKHRSSTRPTSIENLDRLSTTRQSRMPFWSSSSSPTTNDKKPLTLPPNLTPKLFQRSPKEALRRVTSLLIKKGNLSHGKETKKDKTIKPLKKIDEAPTKKKSFFRHFWKRNKNYVLEEG